MRKKIFSIIVLLVLLAIVVWILVSGPSPRDLRMPHRDPNAAGQQFDYQ